MLRLTGKVFGVVAILVVFATLVFYFTAPVYTLRGIPVLNYHQVNDEKFFPIDNENFGFQKSNGIFTRARLSCDYYGRIIRLFAE